jgi:hypothetical protein
MYGLDLSGSGLGPNGGLTAEYQLFKHEPAPGVHYFIY